MLELGEQIGRQGAHDAVYGPTSTDLRAAAPPIGNPSRSRRRTLSLQDARVNAGLTCPARSERIDPRCHGSSVSENSLHAVYVP